jgi:hypothetical protein
MPEQEQGQGQGGVGGVAIDNTGLLDGYHHGDPPSPSQIALHVRGARLQGGNVVWRAPRAAGGSGGEGGFAIPAPAPDPAAAAAAAVAAVTTEGATAASRGGEMKSGGKRGEGVWGWCCVMRV